MLLELDVTFAHHEDMGESLGVVCGVSVHPDPRYKTLDREGRYIKDYIKAYSSSHTGQPEYAPVIAPTARVLDKTFDLMPDTRFTCWDGSTATLDYGSTATLDSTVDLWSLHKDNGMSYWGYTNDEIQRILVREVAQ